MLGLRWWLILINHSHESTIGYKEDMGRTKSPHSTERGRPCISGDRGAGWARKDMKYFNSQKEIKGTEMGCDCQAGMSSRRWEQGHCEPTAYLGQKVNYERDGGE